MSTVYFQYGELNRKPVQGICAVTHMRQNKKPVKRLNYNPREIRNALLRANRLQTASAVLSRAKSKYVSLAKCQGSGMYDEAELAAAVIHARQMVRCVRMKMNHLRQEENSRKSDGQEKTDADQKERKMKRRIRNREQELKAKQKMEELELAKLRRIHRNKELRKMNEADAEYSASIYKRTRNSASYSYSGDSIRVQLSSEALRRAKEQLEQQEQAAADIAYAEMEIMEMEEKQAAECPAVQEGCNAFAETGAIAEPGAYVDAAIG